MLDLSGQLFDVFNVIKKMNNYKHSFNVVSVFADIY